MTTPRRPSISTHVLDTERGEPAEGLPVPLSRLEGNGLTGLAEAETNQDGRISDLLAEPLEIGTYQLAFDIGVYFRELDGDVPFLSRVAIDFEILDSDRHYHIPLLLSRYACS